MSTPPGTIAFNGAELEQVISRVVSAHMPKPPPPLTTWRQIKLEWTKPAGLIPAMSFFAFALIGGITAYNAIQANTSANARQDEYNREVVGPLIKTVERLEGRQTQAEDRMRDYVGSQKELTTSWVEWRKGVETSLQSARDSSNEVGRLSGRADAQDQRSSRIFDTLSGTINNIQQQLNSIERAVAVLSSKLEDGRRSNVPFPKAPAVLPSLPSPPILRATFRQRQLSRVVARRVGKRRVARPRTFLVSLTRALERMGGKPGVRRRGWP